MSLTAFDSQDNNTLESETPMKQSKGLKGVLKIGPYRRGPKIGANCPVKCIQQVLVRREDTDEFYIAKILTLKPSNEKQTVDDEQGRVLLHTEYSLLKLLDGEPGIVHQHGLLRDVYMEDNVERQRMCLILDCYTPHDFNKKFNNLTNLQYYVIKEKMLEESDAIRIFYNIVQIVERLHAKNIVHRDLKLGNIIYNLETKELVISNFCLGKHLTSENEMLRDQRGSPAYISPEVISGNPYLGKPSDMWALGVVLYTMLFGQFPFYDQKPTELFNKIKNVNYCIPMDTRVGQECQDIIKSLLVRDVSQRPTATQLREQLQSRVMKDQAFSCDYNLQVVPSCPVAEGRPKRTITDVMVEIEEEILAKVACDDLERLISKSESVNQKDDDEHDSHEPPRKVARLTEAPRALPVQAKSSRVRCTQRQQQQRLLVTDDIRKLLSVRRSYLSDNRSAFGTAGTLQVANPQDRATIVATVAKLHQMLVNTRAAHNSS